MITLDNYCFNLSREGVNYQRWARTFAYFLLIQGNISNMNHLEFIKENEMEDRFFSLIISISNYLSHIYFVGQYKHFHFHILVNFGKLNCHNNPWYRFSYHNNPSLVLYTFGYLSIQ